MGLGAEHGERAGGGSGVKPEGLVESGTGRQERDRQAGEGQAGSGAVWLVTGSGPGGRGETQLGN